MTRRATLPILAAIALAYVAWRWLREPAKRLPAFEPVSDEQGGWDGVERNVFPYPLPGIATGQTSAAPWYWAQCGHSHPWGIACSVLA